MAQAFVITLEKEIPTPPAASTKSAAGRGGGGGGKALAREAERLDTAARAKHVPALTAFLSESPAALIAQLKAEGFDPAKMRLPPEQWFPASEGLKTIRALHEYVTNDLNKFRQPNPILRDLKSAEALLAAAEAAGVKFHFTKTDL